MKANDISVGLFINPKIRPFIYYAWVYSLVGADKVQMNLCDIVDDIDIKLYIATSAFKIYIN